MTIEQILEILENYKLRIPPTVFYDLKADILNFEEPTTKNCESCRYYGLHHEVCNYCYKCSLWTEQEPTTKNDLGVDCISRQAVIDLMMQKWGENFSGDDAMQESIDAIRELPSVTPQEPQTFKWCTDCKEYNQEKHCCHRWSKVIRNTVEEMKQEYIEREVLDKIRAEIEQLPTNTRINWDGCCPDIDYPEIEYVDVTKNGLLSIIDKYKAENNS